MIGAALLVGSLSYGRSIVLDEYALRLADAAREAASFATAPFVGALAAACRLRESLGALVVTATCAPGAARSVDVPVSGRGAAVAPLP